MEFFCSAVDKTANVYIILQMIILYGVKKTLFSWVCKKERSNISSRNHKEYCHVVSSKVNDMHAWMTLPHKEIGQLTKCTLMRSFQHNVQVWRLIHMIQKFRLEDYTKTMLQWENYSIVHNSSRITHGELFPVGR